MGITIGISPLIVGLVVMVVFFHVHSPPKRSQQGKPPWKWMDAWSRGEKNPTTWGLLAYFQGRLVSFRETIFLKGCIVLFFQLHIFFLAVYHGVIQVNRELQIKGTCCLEGWTQSDDTWMWCLPLHARPKHQKQLWNKQWQEKNWLLSGILLRVQGGPLLGINGAVSPYL